MSTQLSKPHRLIRHCKSCWREDFHTPIQYPAVIKGFLIVASLGLVLLFHPKQCICCGTKRYL